MIGLDEQVWIRNAQRRNNMLERAHYLSKQGIEVLVVASKPLLMVHLISEAERRFGPDRNITFTTHRSGYMEGFDWKTMSFHSPYKRTVVLVDPALIEEAFSDLLLMLHAFDPPPQDATTIPAIQPKLNITGETYSALIDSFSAAGVFGSPRFAEFLNLANQLHSNAKEAGNERF